MAQVLALYYSLTRQSEQVMNQIVEALRQAGHEVTLESLELTDPYPLPVPPDLMARLLRQALTGAWPVVDLKPIQADTGKRYDLILLGYQPWYMTPSVPVHSLLKGPQGMLLSGSPVVGVVTCRAMSGRATRLFRTWVEGRGGRLVEQRVFVDQDHRPTNMLTLTHFLKHGRDPESGLLRRLLKPYGVGEPGLRMARAYGHDLARRLNAGPLQGDGEVRVLR